MKNRSISAISQLSEHEIEAYIGRITDENQLYKKLLEIQRDGLILTDKSARVFFSNKKANEILDFELFNDISPFYSYISTPELKKAFETSLSSGRVYREEFRMQKGDIVRYISLIGVPFLDKYLYILSDVTDRKKELYELKRLESLAAISSVSSILAHDINNPLSAISIQLDLIKRNLGKKSDDFHKEHLDIIKDEVERIKGIVKNFLYSAKPLDIVPLLHSSEELLDRIVEFISPLLDENSITLKLDIHKPLPYMEYDFDLMHSVMMNIIKNAVEAMNNSDEKVLTISAQRVANDLEISITDTGCGIPAQAMDDIFKPYFTTKKSGTGLGLSNVYKIIKMHSGDIRAQSNQKGSTFTISLPVKKENSLTLDSKH